MEKLLKILLYGIIFALPFGVLSRFTLQSNIAISVLDVIVLVFDLVSIIIYKTKLVKTQKKITGALIIFTLVASVGYIYSLDFSVNHLITSILYLARFVSYVFAFFPIVILTQKSKLSYLQTMVFSGILFAFFGLFQYFLYPNLANLRYLGWDDHLYRVFSTFFDPNFAGAFLGLTLILTLYLYINTKKGLKLNMVYGFGVILISSSFFLTYSRSSYIAFLVAILVFFAQARKFKFVFLAIIVFSMGILFIPKNLKSEGVHLLRTASVMARGIEYSKSIQIFLKNPITGTGFNTYRYEQKKNGFMVNIDTLDNSGAGLPNSFLLVLATTGIFGLFAFIYLIISLIQKSFHFKNREIYIRSLLFSSMILVVIGSMFENLLFYPPILIWVILLYGIMEKGYRR